MLMAAFSKRYPSVTQAKIIVDPVTRQSKGYGFIKFSNSDDAQRAIQEMNGKYLLAKAMKLNYAAQKKNEGAGPSMQSGPSYHGSGGQHYGGGGGGHHHPVHTSGGPGYMHPPPP
jgi:RNA recognition motif-containing protein